jgi:hypothetical protein
MELQTDFKELLVLLNAHEVDYLSLSRTKGQRAVSKIWRMWKRCKVMKKVVYEHISRNEIEAAAPDGRAAADAGSAAAGAGKNDLAGFYSRRQGD